MMKTWIVPVALGLVALTAAQSPAIAQRGIGPNRGGSFTSDSPVMP